MTKQYIGDAVYVDWDGYALVLTTEDGIRVISRIVLEPEVYTALVQYVERLSDEYRQDNRSRDHEI